MVVPAQLPTSSAHQMSGIQRLSMVTGTMLFDVPDNYSNIIFGCYDSPYVFFCCWEYLQACRPDITSAYKRGRQTSNSMYTMHLVEDYAA